MKKALVVGINNYPFAPLRGCINDATDIAHLLERNDDDTTNFSVLLKTNVSRKNMLKELIVDLFAGKNDTVLFYFSGHGFFNELGGYLVTPDHDKHDEGISMSELLTLANKSSSTNKIIILDCCHSGAITVPALAHESTGHINEGITILSASRQDEVAVEVRGRGIFTNLLIEALKGGAADINGSITPGSIYTYIDQALGPWDQRPVFKTNVSRFISLRNITAQLPVTMLRKITDYFPNATDEFLLAPSFEYTNNPEYTHEYIPPFTVEEHVSTFKALQKMHSAGLVEPIGEAHMYWAAMKSKSCRLTALGEHYWRLVYEKKI